MILTVYNLKQSLSEKDAYSGFRITLKQEANGEWIGTCAVSSTVQAQVATIPSTKVRGTQLLSSLMKEYPGVTEFNARIVGSGTIRIGQDALKALKVEVEPVSAPVVFEEIPLLKPLRALFKAQSNPITYQMDLQRYQRGEKLLVELRKGSDGVETYADTNLLGVLATENEDLEIALELKKTLTGEITAMNQEQFEVLTHISEEEVNAYRLEYILGSSKQQVLKQGFLSAQALEEIIEFLMEIPLTPMQIKRVLATYRTYPEGVRNRIPKKPRPIFKDYDGHLKSCIVYMLINRHIVLDGPAATGKNTLIETLAWLFQRPLYEMSINKRTDEYGLMGDKTLDYTVVQPQLIQPQKGMGFEEQMLIHETNKTNIAWCQNQKGQRVVFDKGLFVEAMEVGGLFCFDEINASAPELMSILNSSLDYRGRVHVPFYGQVQADPNFVAIATMNNGYIGMGDLNEALSSRFTHLILDYPPSIESILVENVPTAKKDHVRRINTLYQELAKGVKSDEFPLPQTCINVRGFITSLIAAEDLGLYHSLIHTVANGIKNPEDRMAVTHAIKMVIPAKA